MRVQCAYEAMYGKKQIGCYGILTAFSRRMVFCPNCRPSGNSRRQNGDYGVHHPDNPYYNRMIQCAECGRWTCSYSPYCASCRKAKTSRVNNRQKRATQERRRTLAQLPKQITKVIPVANILTAPPGRCVDLINEILQNDRCAMGVVGVSHDPHPPMSQSHQHLMSQKTTTAGASSFIRIKT